MAEQDFKFDDALLMKTAREMLAKKLTETVKEAAKSGEWEITTIEQEEPDPEKILRRMFAKYAYGNVPEWFASAVSATSYASLDDILTREGILKDDNISIIRNRDGSRVFYDKEHPRAEIYIYEYRKEEDNAAGNENLHR